MISNDSIKIKLVQVSDEDSVNYHAVGDTDKVKNVIDKITSHKLKNNFLK